MNYRLFIILLVAVILITGCVSKNKETVVIPTQTSTLTSITPTLTITLCEKKCNDICYDPSKQSCCFGTILDGSWREVLSDGSCNNLNFKSTNMAYEEWYCGGVRYHLNEDISCCNGTSYNDDTNQCSNGKVESGTSIPTLEFTQKERTTNIPTTSIPSLKYSRIKCGENFCSTGFFCCNNFCYDPTEGNTGSCCGSSPCARGWGCCHTVDGNKCYDPSVYKCVPKY
jgi:hypothetical protein